LTVLTLGLLDSLAIVGIGVALGLIGSWFAAARHMRAIEPK
jgi:cell division protein FtsX